MEDCLSICLHTSLRIMALPPCRPCQRAFVGRTLAMLLTSAAISMPAFAGRPLVTEDAPIQPADACVVDSYGGEIAHASTGDTRTLSSEFACGVGSRTELGLGYEDSRVNGDAKRSLLFAGKTALIASQDDQAGLSIAYGAPAEQTARAPARMGDLYLTLAASMPLTAQATVHANLGWSGGLRADGSTTHVAFAFEYAVVDALHLFAETFLDDHDHRPWLQVGICQSVNTWLSLNASYGRQTGSANAQGATLGFSVAF